MLIIGLLATKSQAPIAIARRFLSLSFLNARSVCLHAKEYYIFRTIYITITQNVSHYNEQPLLEIMPNAISESLYFGVGPYICPISAIYFHCARKLKPSLSNMRVLRDFSFDKFFSVSSYGNSFHMNFFIFFLIKFIYPGKYN